ncbi:MAG: hypothetical protein Q9187_004137 [Circinaria calcarea]
MFLNMIPRKPLSNYNSTPKTAPPKVPTSGVRRKELPVNTGIQSPFSTPNIAHRYKALPQTDRRLDEEYDQLSVGNRENVSAFGSTENLLAGTKVQTATITSSTAAEELSKVSISEDPSYVNVVSSPEGRAPKESPSAIAKLLCNKRTSNSTRLSLEEALRYASLNDIIQVGNHMRTKDGSMLIDFKTYVDLQVTQATLLETLESGTSDLLCYFPRSFPSLIRELSDAIADPDASGPEIFVAVVNLVKKAKQDEAKKHEAKKHEAEPDEAKPHEAKQEETSKDGKALSKRQKKTQKKKMDKGKQREEEGKEGHPRTQGCVNLFGQDMYDSFLTAIKEQKVTRNEALYLVDAVMTAMTEREEAEIKETALPQLKVLHSIYLLQQQQNPNYSVH